MTTPLIGSRVVPPSHSRWEGMLLLAAIATLVLVTGLNAYYLGRGRTELTLLDWQISAYSELSGVDQAIYQEMVTALEEIFDLHLALDYWPEQPEFQEFYLPPFYRDATWERNGAVFWLMRDETPEGGSDGITFYHGSGGTVPGQGSYLILINHSHTGIQQVNDATLWWHPDPDTETPVHPTLSSLILAGWRQIVPYSGRDERERLR